MTIINEGVLVCKQDKENICITITIGSAQKHLCVVYDV